MYIQRNIEARSCDHCCSGSITYCECVFVAWCIQHAMGMLLIFVCGLPGCRLRLKCDGTRAETRVCLSGKGTSPFKSAGASVQSTAGSRGVRISVSNAGYTTFRGLVRLLATPTPFASFPFTSPPVRHCVPSHSESSIILETTIFEVVKGIDYPLHSPVSPSLPLPCVTVCLHISTGFYNILPHYLTNGTIFGGKVIEYRMCVLFSLQLCLKRFSF